jgi:hypothetical protein
MNILRRVLNLGAHEPASAARVRLCTALADRDHAQAELSAAQAAVERVLNVIDNATDARRSAKRARQEATTAAEKWAAAGADLNAAGDHERLVAIAIEHELAADDAQNLADAATKGLATVKATESNCKSIVNSALAAIREAKGMILADEIAPDLEQLEATAREFERLLLRVMAVFRTVSSTRPGWRDSIEHESHEAAAIIKAALERSQIRELGEIEMRNGFPVARKRPSAALEERTEEIREYARRLASDPNATFS